MKWIIEGRDKRTGQGAQFRVEAESVNAARSMGTGLGVAVAAVRLDPSEAGYAAAARMPRRFGRCGKCNRYSLWLVFGIGSICGRCRRAEAAEERRQADDRRVREAAAKEEERRLLEGLRASLYQDLCGLFATGQHHADRVRGLLDEYARRGLRDTAEIRRAVYHSAVESASSDQIITDRERQALQLMRRLLNLDDRAIGDIDSNLARMEFIWALQRGQLPVLANPGISLQRNEVTHFVFDGVQFNQERVVERGYVGGSQGVSIRIAKGLSYRVGSHRGQYVSRSAVVSVDAGRLILTSKRLIFSGGSKGFTIPLGKIVNMTPYADGVAVVKDSVAQNNKPFYFLYPDAEILNLGLSACMNAAA